MTIRKFSYSKLRITWMLYWDTRITTELTFLIENTRRVIDLRGL